MPDTSVRNVFILSVDSLSYPYFDTQTAALAEQLDAVNFRNAVAPASNTRCSATALHAGLFADSELLHQSPIRVPETGEPMTVAEQFAAADYETGFWTPNQIFGASNNYDRGFQHGNKGVTQNNKKAANFLKRHGTEWLFDIAQTVYFRAVKPLSGKLQSNEGYVWTPASSVQEDVLTWFEGNHSTPTFCWVHYMDTHHPFEPPEDYLNKKPLNHSWDRDEISFFTRDAIKTNAEGLTQNEIEDVRLTYEAVCDYLSDQVQSFISTLLERDHYDPDKDLLCFTADHGEAFAPDKHGLFGHASFFEEIVRVPLVISHPDWDAQTIDEQVSLIDLMPTILNLAEIPIPDTFEGMPHRSPQSMQREYAYVIDSNPVRRGIRGNGQKLFAHRIDGEFEIVQTAYSPEDKSEEIVFRAPPDEFFDSDILTDTRDELYKTLKEAKGDLLE